MARISSSKLQLQFAKAKEAEGRWQEAAAAYEAAGDMDAVVRLCLERLSQPQRAYAIVRKTQSVEAANQLSRFCLQSQDFGGAVEFLLMAGQMDQAFDIAMGHNEMDTFARIVAASAKPVDYQRIAQYYESRGEYDKAADMWSKCDQAPRAVQLYLKVGACACAGASGPQGVENGDTLGRCSATDIAVAAYPTCQAPCAPFAHQPNTVRLAVTARRCVHDRWARTRLWRRRCRWWSRRAATS